jgi:hypothetical protein
VVVDANDELIRDFDDVAVVRVVDVEDVRVEDVLVKKMFVVVDVVVVTVTVTDIFVVVEVLALFRI